MAKSTSCNICGKTFGMWDEINGFTCEAVLGYGSKYDGMGLELDICCDCMDKLIDNCKISPLVDLESPEVDLEHE